MLENSLPSEPPVTLLLSILNTNISASDVLTILICIGVVVLFIVCSAIISSSENALFSLTPIQVDEITQDESRTSECIKYLLNHPKHLLATILISNTFVNISIVLVLTVVIGLIFDFSQNHLVGFLIEVVLVTFLLVLFGEVMPKMYASQNNARVARFVSIPMFTLSKLLKPFVLLLVNSTSIIDKRVTKKGHVLSVEELTHAIDITNEEETPKEEKVILKSIVQFGNISVKQIMRQRPDVTAIRSDTPFRQLLMKINDWGYSRVPVYSDNLDNIQGVLYIKDLLPQLHEDDQFQWTSLLRKPYFVPESKKIDDLLKEFQSKRVHLAIVVDEFGGTQGIVTMEDILEEIFGEINDEFDDDEIFYSRIDDNTYVFEAKIAINDMCKFMGIDLSVFEQARQDADTVGGMLLELQGEMPKQGDVIVFENYKFIIESADKRRIKRIKVEVMHEQDSKA
ncbi:MAG: gliding motility-associated protein GldE [Bacteroidetes bacterium]|nr:MAG: gliding motility-associated protein GldE [Bacteroidota bacterium]